MNNSEAAKRIFATLVEEGLIEDSQEVYYTILFAIDFSGMGQDNDDNINEEEYQQILQTFRESKQKPQGPLQ
ncbi:MAG: hypothetical protein MJ157_02865 [Clostridia bacterium]|nr:hypothetical protein [Clostridia bacterium]